MLKIPFLMLNFLILIIFTLVGVAYITLFERKILGLMQIRLGPNKIGTMGLLQPFSDAVKLYTKEYNLPSKSNYILYFISPVMALSFSLIIWLTAPYFNSILKMNLSILFLISILGLSVYTIMMAGWSSNSVYALIGSLRCIAQTISYEVTLSFIILCLVMFPMKMSLISVVNHQSIMWFMIFLPLFFMWFTSCLAELNRTPFDFAEGESELVSGFNIEYSSSGFAIIFMAEYCSIIFLSMLTMMIFMGGKMYSVIGFMMSMIMMFSFIWLRATMPRFRYDKLMTLTWKLFLPSSLNLLTFFMLTKMFL